MHTHFNSWVFGGISVQNDLISPLMAMSALSTKLTIDVTQKYSRHAVYSQISTYVHAYIPFPYWVSSLRNVARLNIL